jgi:hypothetical protein
VYLAEVEKRKQERKMKSLIKAISAVKPSKRPAYTTIV